jgi:hypothetical protein
MAKSTPRKRDLVIFGVLLPNIILVVAMLAIAKMNSRADAGEFGGLAVFFMLLISLPITLTTNALMLLRGYESVSLCFRFAMTPPGLVLLAAVIYQSGLWDAIT